ncbi:hypothetical protein KAU34_01875, partial [candidate division WOR-3 bacterium]|nr:hypothetical protein [candidate division WOR-3 bacterium]
MFISQFIVSHDNLDQRDILLWSQNELFSDISPVFVDSCQITRFIRDFFSSLLNNCKLSRKISF